MQQLQVFSVATVLCNSSFNTDEAAAMGDDRNSHQALWVAFKSTLKQVSLRGCQKTVAYARVCQHSQPLIRCLLMDLQMLVAGFDL